jgi:hypothetical protein
MHYQEYRLNAGRETERVPSLLSIIAYPVWDQGHSRIGKNLQSDAEADPVLRQVLPLFHVPLKIITSIYPYTFSGSSAAAGRRDPSTFSSSITAPAPRNAGGSSTFI